MFILIKKMHGMSWYFGKLKDNAKTYIKLYICLVKSNHLKYRITNS